MSANPDVMPTRRRARQPAPLAPDPYMCRVGGGAFALVVLKELGFDPVAVLTGAGLDPVIFRNPDSIVPLADFYRMAEICHQCSGRSDFGLLVAGHAGASGGGLIWQLAQSAPDVRTALESLTRFIHLNLRWGLVQLSVEGNIGSLVFSLVLPGAPSAPVIEDATIGILFAFMRELCGPSWRPTEVFLSHKQGANPAAYTAYFGAPVRYNSVTNALLFPAVDLRRLVSKATRLLQTELAGKVDEVAQAWPLTFAEDIRRSIRGNMNNPMLSAEFVSDLLGINRRTLSQRLAAEGTSFSELHSSLRYESARVLLRDSVASLLAISAALGYSEQSAFNRAFKMWSGMSPKRFRLS